MLRKNCVDANNLIAKAEDYLQEQFRILEEIATSNQEKILQAFIKNKVGEEHFYSVTGYGHHDLGRDVIDKVFSDVFGGETALVRIHFASGTHAIASALFGNLRYGDEMISATGRPYDTLETVIGKNGYTYNSLMGHGVIYQEIPLNHNQVDLDRLLKAISPKTKLVAIQKSRGYQVRNALSIQNIQHIIQTVKSVNPHIICFVDNCYGEFIERQEPLDVGADLIAGSLIKNPGGGIVLSGGYVVGKQEYVFNTACTLASLGVAQKGGAMLNQNRTILQGLFMAPNIVLGSLKGSVLLSYIFEQLGYEVYPKYNELRTDLIQALVLKSPDAVIHFCKLLQKYSPISSYVVPEPSNVVGYQDKLVMAGGTFIDGSTIELSADAPLRDPYIVYIQGGLSYLHVKTTLKLMLNEFLTSSVIK